MAKSDRVEMIDGLRGVAALSVVLYHFIGFLPLMQIKVGWFGAVVIAVTRRGFLGVPIFFVLSGYVIAMTAARYEFTAATGARFVLRRLVRIVPPYWVMILLIAATFSAGHLVGLFRNTAVTPRQVGAHLVYAQDVLKFTPLDIPFWTLCLEVQFYIVFAISAVMVRQLSPNFRLGWIASLTSISVAVDLRNIEVMEWFIRLWFEFGLGVLAFYATRERPAKLVLQVMLLAITSIGVYVRRPEYAITTMTAGVLFYTAVRANARRFSSPSLILWLGRISYSLYLVHGFIGLGLSIAFRTGGIRSESLAWLTVAAGVVVVLAFATGFHHLCEMRGVEWSRRIRIAPSRVAKPESFPASTAQVQ